VQHPEEVRAAEPDQPARAFLDRPLETVERRVELAEAGVNVPDGPRAFRKRLTHRRKPDSDTSLHGRWSPFRQAS
jgi:hypothetical protein